MLVSHSYAYFSNYVKATYACLPPSWPVGPATDEQQENDSCRVQMQNNPCYAVIHQGSEEDRKEDIVDAQMQMIENPSYVYNTVTLAPRYQSACLHDKLDCAIYKQVENL